MVCCCGGGKGTKHDINCTYDWLVRWEYLPEVQHERHEAEETQQMFAHGGPGIRSGRRLHTVPDVHVKVPVHLQRKVEVMRPNTGRLMRVHV